MSRVDVHDTIDLLLRAADMFNDGAHETTAAKERVGKKLSCEKVKSTTRHAKRNAAWDERDMIRERFLYICPQYLSGLRRRCCLTPQEPDFTEKFKLEVTTAAHAWIQFVSKNMKEDDVRSVISTLHKNLYTNCPPLTSDYLSAAVRMRVLHVMNQLQQEFPINRRGMR
eukprot:6205372-Pleurochrysis_carterae.AAC.1